MPKPFPKPSPDAHYVGDYTTFFPVKIIPDGTCDWCDKPNLPLVTYDANDGIFVNICRRCELTARSLSTGGFMLKRTLVPIIQKKRAEQIAASKDTKVEV